MKLVYLVAAGEVVLGAVTGVYLLVALAFAEPPPPEWLVVVAGATFWWAFLELLRHARELVRKQRSLNNRQERTE